jgi:hypothetical protein
MCSISSRVVIEITHGTYGAEDERWRPWSAFGQLRIT